MHMSDAADVSLHPIAAALQTSMVRSDDKTTVSFPTEAIEAARVQLKGHSADSIALVHLLAVAAKIQRVVGERGIAAVVAIGLLVAEVLGSAEAAADRMQNAGLQNAAAKLLGHERTISAPTAGEVGPGQKPPRPRLRG
jgi:hypothetical protein